MIEIDFGILIAQIVTFLIGMGLLWKISWGPLPQMMKERSTTIQKELDAAQQKRSEAEKLESSYRQQLAAIEQKTHEMMNQTQQEALVVKEQILRTAQEESKRLMEKNKELLEAERLRLIGELRQEVSQLVVKGTEKLLRQSVDRQKQEQWSKEFLAELDQYTKK
jgi:F-type H+-transporting ATPase subunit b